MLVRMSEAGTTDRLTASHTFQLGCKQSVHSSYATCEHLDHIDCAHRALSQFRWKRAGLGPPRRDG
jgi:hypothetical protein